MSIRWKKAVAQRIFPHIPPHSKYVELFAGSATIFFAKEKASENVLNDMDIGITEVLKFIKAGDRCPVVKMSKEKFQAITQKPQKNPCAHFTLIKTAWGCTDKFAPTKVPKCIIHVLASIRLRQYNPGLITSLIANIPLGLGVLIGLGLSAIATLFDLIVGIALGIILHAALFVILGIRSRKNPHT